MKFLILFVCSLTVVAADERTPRLTGGAAAILGEFPAAVFIRSPGTPNQPLCGGTIIDRRHVRIFL